MTFVGRDDCLITLGHRNDQWTTKADNRERGGEMLYNEGEGQITPTHKRTDDQGQVHKTGNNGDNVKLDAIEY